MIKNYLYVTWLPVIPLPSLYARQVPLAMDCTDKHILISSAPLELLVLQLQHEGGSTVGVAGGSSASEGGLKPAAAVPGRPPSAQPGGAKLVTVRELSLFNVGRPVQDVALVSAAAADMVDKAIRGVDGLWSTADKLVLVQCDRCSGTRYTVVFVLWHMLAG
jgi:hypothetical protein